MSDQAPNSPKFTPTSEQDKWEDNRFKIPWDLASRQIQELNELKRNNEAALYEKQIATAPWLKP